MPEIFATATNIYSVNFRYFEVLSVVSVWYLLLTGALTVLQRRLEAHYGTRWTAPGGRPQGVLSRVFGLGATPAG